jgi:Indoleamine 2,3-dioxygenase
VCSTLQLHTTADDLPKLLGARLGQARGPLRQLPALKIDKLVTDAELRRAHLLRCIFAHAYIWGGPEPMDEIPEGIAIPLWEVAKRLDMPPVLGHPSIVLYNWRRLDAEADICMENLSTLNNFFDGRDESWFYLITVELEQRGAASVVPMMLLIDAIQRYKEEAKHLTSQRERTESTTSTGRAETLHQTPDPVDLHSDDDFSWEELRSNDDYDGGSGDQDDSPREEEALLGEVTSNRVATYVTMQLTKIADAIMGMVLSMGAMREGCHPFIFYNRVRPFLSAWKNNPTLNNGVIYQVSLETTELTTIFGADLMQCLSQHYQGVSQERQHFYGGSAAQSSLLPFLDIGNSLITSFSLRWHHKIRKSCKFQTFIQNFQV